MASQAVGDMAYAATEENKFQYRSCWYTYLETIDQYIPQIILPKAVGDLLGHVAVEEIARRFGYFVEETVSIKFDPALNAFRVGASCDFPHDPKHIHLKNLSYEVPQTQVTSPAIYRSVQHGSAFHAIDGNDEKSCAGDPEDEQVSKSEAFKSSELDEHFTLQRLKVGKIPKPSNCFIIYRREKQELVKSANPTMINVEISKVIGRMWAKEPAHIKAQYQDLAVREKQKLMVNHPTWKCSPRKSSDIKKRKTLMKSQGKDGHGAPSVTQRPNLQPFQQFHLNADQQPSGAIDINSMSDAEFSALLQSFLPSSDQRIDASDAHDSMKLMDNQDPQTLENPFSRSFAEQLPLMPW
ncbi:MAG: hypothetical protein M1818_004852 [Claussenomyces sp. TS43310]|nr:MAG: hypothetical protein M1818_004852 [Claussenomyces sp. TS43310]